MSPTDPHELSDRAIRVVNGSPRGAYAKLYRDVLLSPEVVGRVTYAIDPETGKKARNKTKPLTHVGLLVYLYLASYTSGFFGVCGKPWHLSIKRIAADLQLSRNSVYRAIDDLKTRRMLTVTGEKGQPLWYTLMDPPSICPARHDDPADIPNAGKKEEIEPIPNLGQGDPKPDTPLAASPTLNRSQTWDHPIPNLGHVSDQLDHGTKSNSQNDFLGEGQPMDIPTSGSQIGNEPQAMAGQIPVPLGGRVTPADVAQLRSNLSRRMKA